MAASECILCLLFVSLAACYGWGMRGTVIGGEKGAMLPGMYIGLILALFSGGAIAQYFYIPAAAGLIGMTFGGIEPYGDSISLIMDPPPATHNMKKGLTGLALKGALWFAICGGIIGMSISAMGGKYRPLQLVLFCVLCPLAQLAGYIFFNTPVDPKAKKMPKICFSYESREEWGSNVGVLFTLIVFGVFAKDKLMLTMLAFGFAAGALGWLLAMFNYYRLEKPMKNGKYLFGGLRKLIGGWKFMEFTLGAVGGLGIAGGYMVQHGEIIRINSKILTRGIFAPLYDHDTLITVVFVFIFLCLLAINLLEYLWDQKGKEYNSFIMDCIERPFFNLIPLIFVLLGSLPASRFMTAFMLIYACTLKVCFDRYGKKDKKLIPYIIYFGLSILVFVLDIVFDGIPAKWIVFAGGLPYILSEVTFIAAHYFNGSYKFLKNPERSGAIWVMLVQTVIIDVIAFIMF